MEEERQRRLNIGCNAHLSEPISATLLIETLKEIIACRPQYAAGSLAGNDSFELS